MKGLFLVTAFFFFPSLRSIAQLPSANPLFDETNYSQISQNAAGDSSFRLFVRVYKCNLDTGYTLTKMFADSSFSNLMVVTFYKNGLPEGPFGIYDDGQILESGNYKNGLYDGEVKTYNNSLLIRRGGYTNGFKSGTWEEFDLTGKLIRQTIYGASGNIVSDTRY